MVVSACLLSAFSWHWVTLRFSEFLMTAAEPIAGAQWRFRYTDMFGITTVVFDPYFREPAEYQRFINVAGGGSCWGVGRHRDPSRGADAWMGQTLLAASAMSVAGYLAGVGVPRLLVARFGRSGRRSHLTRTVVPIRGSLIGAVLIVPGSLFLWYLAYPRTRLGAGVFEMHAMLQWALPSLAAGIGLVAGSFDMAVEHTLGTPRQARRSCGFPLVNQRELTACIDCGFDPSERTIACLLARRWMRMGLGAGLVLCSVGVLWMCFGPARGAIGVDSVTRWLTLRPLDS